MDHEKYYLNPHLKFILVNEDELLVKHGIRSHFSMILKDKRRTRMLGKVFRHFRSPISVRDLISSQLVTHEEAKYVLDLVSTFYGKRILIKPSEDIFDVYLKSILKGNNGLCHLKFGFVGAGYLGSRIAAQLINFKPNGMVCYDERRTQDVAFERPFFPLGYPLKSEGSYVEGLSSYLSGYGVCNIQGIDGRFDDEDKIGDLFKNTDFVVLGMELFSPHLFHTINKVALATGKPWMGVFIDGSHAVIGPIYVPGETCCYNEFEIQIESTMKHMDQYLLYREYLEDEAASHVTPIIPPLLDIISGYAVMFLADFFARGTSPVSERAIFINFEDMSIDYQNVLKLPRCPACEGTHPTYKHSFE